MEILTIKRILGAALLTMVTAGSFAQDLIARQAPSDKRMKDVHNVKLHNTATFSNVDLENPASDIYTDWTGAVAKCGGHVPANFKIDLRGFSMPTTSRKVTSNFGPRWGRMHKGIDVKVYIGDTIRSAFDGKVRICRYDANGYGYFLVIRHPNGLETVYGHMSKQIVKEGQIVRSGEPIGLGGNTGRSTGSHLHFETRLLGEAINPAFMFDFENQDVTGDTYSITTGAITKEATASATINTVNRIESENGFAANYSTSSAGETNSSDFTQEQATAAVAERRNNNSANANKKKTSQKSASYTIKSGDTLYAIARRHGTTVDKLCKLNGIKATSTLRLGQKIKTS
ncbi:MAG: peptidoglycan DD-metalloendopeptidase family protein [Bacteroidaceae bacterium]|nr:peptidoglycan DD-metalloendopeptidase family protein [Bacteroidaceae bacterium]